MIVAYFLEHGLTEVSALMIVLAVSRSFELVVLRNLLGWQRLYNARLLTEKEVVILYSLFRSRLS